ncbi:MAG: CHAT domain-containing protein [Smithella sp.]
MENENKVRAFIVIVKDTEAEWSLNKVQNEALELIKNVSGKDASGKVKFPEKPHIAERIESLVNFIKILRDLLRQSTSSDEISQIATLLVEQMTEMLGDELYDYLFQDELDKQYHEALGELKQTDPTKKEFDLLRISLEFRGGETAQRLSCWPWEYLHSPQRGDVTYSGHFIAVESELMLTRRVSQGAQSLKFESPLRVLLVVAMPEERGAIISNAVFRKLATLRKKTRRATPDKMKKMGYQIRFQLAKLIDQPEEKRISNSKYQWKATKENLEKVVKKYKPHVVHFIGHGHFDAKQKQATIDMIQKGGSLNPVKENDFATKVKNNNLRLVFLQSCESATQDPSTIASGLARRLALQQIPSIIAMQDKIENDVSGEFAEAFYEELAKSRSIDKAVMAGRKEIKEHNDASWVAFAVPVLYLESQIGMLTEVPGSNPPIIDSTETIDTRNKIPSKIGSTETIDTRNKITCPRCKKELAMSSETKFCTYCRLSFYCRTEECKGNVRYDDPLGTVCQKCGKVIIQEPWLQEELPMSPSIRPPKDQPLPTGTTEPPRKPYER